MQYYKETIRRIAKIGNVKMFVFFDYFNIV